MLDAIHRRDEIEECFARKGTTPVSREVERVQLMSRELDKVLQRFGTLKSSKSTGELEPSKSSDQLEPSKSSDQLASLGTSSADEDGSKGERSRHMSHCSNMSADDKLHFESLKAGHFESQAAQILRQAAAEKAQAEEEKERLRYGDQLKHTHAAAHTPHRERTDSKNAGAGPDAVSAAGGGGGGGGGGTLQRRGSFTKRSNDRVHSEVSVLRA